MADRNKLPLSIASVSFLRNFAYAKFRENKTLRIFEVSWKKKTLTKWRNQFVVNWYRYTMPYSRISNVAIMFFNAFRGNKIPNLQYRTLMKHSIRLPEHCFQFQ